MMIEMNRYLARGIYRSLQWLSLFPFKNQYVVMPNDSSAENFSKRFFMFNKIKQPAPLQLIQYLRTNPMNAETKPIFLQDAKQCFKHGIFFLFIFFK